LAGDREADAFAQLPGVPQKVTDELLRITNNEMLPAIECSDCDTFGDAVYRFNLLAGECFAPVQGGPFANADTVRLVDLLRAQGVTGVGQSSWGPTVFAITPDDAKAQSLVEWLRAQLPPAEYDIKIAQPNNTGAQFSTL
jgi:predicted sugar kinase